jgi:hypothetical protein
MATTRQTSKKSGVKSTARKMDNSRHGFAPHPASNKTAGAFGKEATRGRETGGPRPGKRAALGRQKPNV